MNPSSLRHLCRRLLSRSGVRAIVLALVAFIMLGTAIAPAQAAPSKSSSKSPLQVELSVAKRAVVLGKERWVPTKEIKPGDTIEYRAIYRNVGKTDLQQVKAMLPVPSAGAYVLGSASPDSAQASLDQKTFSAMPLMQRITDDQGQSIDQPVPAEHYRAIRWVIDTLPAGTSHEVSMRVHVFKAGSATPQ